MTTSLHRLLIEIDEFTSDLAVRLTQDHRLRGYGAIHLATALLANRALLCAGMPSLTLAAFDEDFFAAAHGEGLATENPDLYR